MIIFQIILPSQNDSVTLVYRLYISFRRIPFNSTLTHRANILVNLVISACLKISIEINLTTVTECAT